jgi:hypothetical protein
VFRGGIPAWLDGAGAHNNPDFLAYVVAIPQQAAGFLFSYPLTARHAQNYANKILWVVGLPRNGSPLAITGHPISSVTPSISVTQPANSGPGEIYPSLLEVPVPGCWHFDLAWSGHKASVDLVFH